MNTFLTSRSCIVSIGANSSKIYDIPGLDYGVVEDGAVLLIDAIHIHKTDAVTPKDALDDKHAFYVYGKSFGTVSIRGTLFLGNASNSSAGENIIGKVTKWFKSNRVSTSNSPVPISISKSFKGNCYITKLVFGETDPRVNAIGFSIDGYVSPTEAN